VIPPAVEDEGPLRSTAEERAILGLEPADFVVTYCGNLDAYQNLAVLLAAMARLPARERQASGAERRPRLIVATHSASQDLEREAAAAGLGERFRVLEAATWPEVRRALAVADVLALPRRLGSGYPVKLLNYMSAAKAVVTAGCGAKVLRDGVDGVVVADDDPAALADALERCRRQPAWCEALGEAARQTYLERLTWDVVLPQIEGVYAGLREPGRRSERRS
jgi:glycosyltransferase involved in cell wall biosynthesis